MDTTKSLDELKRELEQMKVTLEQETRNLERQKQELREAYDRLAMRQDEKRQLDGELTKLLTRLMMRSDVGFAELVLKSIAELESDLKKPDAAMVAKDHEIVVLDREFNGTLGKLSGVELEQELARAKIEDENLKRSVRERKDELQALKMTKDQKREDSERRRKKSRRKIGKLTKHYSDLHKELIDKKYGCGGSPESSQAMTDNYDD